MSIRDQILAEQSETLQEKTAIASKLKDLMTGIDQGLTNATTHVQNIADPQGANRREKEGPDREMETLPKPPKRRGEDRRSSTNEDIAKLAEMLGKGVERHIGTNIPKKYSPKKGGTEADRKRLGRKAKEGEEIVRLSPDLMARISTDEAFAEMTPAQQRDRDHKDNPTRKTVAGVKLPSTDDERKRYAKDFRVKRGYGTGVGNKQRKLKDLTLKDSTEFANSVMENLGKLREDSPPNRSTLKLQPKPLSNPREPAKITPDKGLSQDARELLATKGLSRAIVGRRGPDGRPLDKSAGGISRRHAKAQGELVASGEIPPRKLREDSPPNRATLKLQPIRRYTSKTSPDLRGKPQQHGGPGPDSVTSTNDKKARMDRLRGTFSRPDGTTLKPKEEK